MRFPTLAVVAAAGLACASASAVDLRLKARVDLFNTVVAQINGSPNANRIGTNPATVCLVGDTLYVAGFNNGVSPSLTAPIVKLTDIYTSPGAPTITPFAPRSIPLFYGYVGMDYQPGSGLVVSFDNYNSSTPGQLKRYDLSGATPVEVASSPAGLRGSSGPAYDNGFDGSGYPLPSTGTGPAVSVLNFGDPGVYGLDPTTLDFTVGATVYELGANDFNLRLDFAGISGTTWRDLAIHPTNGTMAARANNDLVIGNRPNDSKNFVGQHLIDLGDAPFQGGQNVEITDGLGADDFVIYNDRRAGNGGQAFSAVVGFAKLDGTAATVNLLNSDPPVDGFLADGNAWYDFSWDSANQRLAVLDFNDYYVYIFELDTGNNCPADFNGDTFVDDTDFVLFAQSYDLFTVPPANPATDLNGDSFVDDTDFVLFAQAYDQFVCP